jgi:hypothetical protein
MSSVCGSGPDWDNLSNEEYERYLLCYEFFDEWLHGTARKSGITLDEYDEIHRQKFKDLTLEEDLYPEYGCGPGPGEGAYGEEGYGTGGFYHPDDDED